MKILGTLLVTVFAINANAQVRMSAGSVTPFEVSKQCGSVAAQSSQGVMNITEDGKVAINASSPNFVKSENGKKNSTKLEYKTPYYRTAKKKDLLDTEVTYYFNDKEQVTEIQYHVKKIEQVNRKAGKESGETISKNLPSYTVEKFAHNEFGCRLTQASNHYSDGTELVYYDEDACKAMLPLLVEIESGSCGGLIKKLNNTYTAESKRIKSKDKNKQLTFVHNDEIVSDNGKFPNILDLSNSCRNYNKEAQDALGSDSDTDTESKSVNSKSAR